MPCVMGNIKKTKGEFQWQTTTKDVGAFRPSVQKVTRKNVRQKSISTDLKGKELTDYEAGMRSGYLQAQSDHAGLFKYKKALAEGKTKAEAKKISRQKGKK